MSEYQLKYAKKKFTNPSYGSYIKISGNFCRQIVAIFSSLPKIGWVEQMYMMSEVIPLMIVAQQNANKWKKQEWKIFSFVYYDASSLKSSTCMLHWKLATITLLVMIFDAFACASFSSSNAKRTTQNSLMFGIFYAL